MKIGRHFLALGLALAFLCPFTSLNAWVGQWGGGWGCISDSQHYPYVPSWWHDSSEAFASDSYQQDVNFDSTYWVQINGSFPNESTISATEAQNRATYYSAYEQQSSWEFYY